MQSQRPNDCELHKRLNTSLEAMASNWNTRNSSKLLKLMPYSRAIGNESSTKVNGFSGVY